MSIGDNIKRYRKENKISQAKLAELIGKSKSSIEKYESNKVRPPIEILRSISKELNVPISSLIVTDRLKYDNFTTELFDNVNYSDLNDKDKENVKELLKVSTRLNSLLNKNELHKYMDGEKIEKIYKSYIDGIEAKHKREIEHYKTMLELEREKYKHLEDIYKDLQNNFNRILSL